MNNCVLMATVIRKPELRYTQENQTPISQMLVEFSGMRPEDPPQTLKVVGWGNLGTEMQQTYTEGDRLIIEGRLSIQMVQMDGYKEKKAELVANRIHPLTGDHPKPQTRPASASYSPPKGAGDSTKVIDLDRYKNANQPPAPMPPSGPEPSLSDENLDDIPF